MRDLNQLRKQLGIPETDCELYAVILGSGIELSLKPKSKSEISYSEIENFPEVSVKGHKGTITHLKFANKKSLISFSGRFHLYEGLHKDEVTLIVKLIRDLGIQNLLITNAAGGINEGFQVGDLMIIDEIKDFQNLANLEDPLGLLNCLEKPALRINSSLKDKIIEQNNDLKRGCYVAVLGPNFESLSEIKLFKKLNCDAVGMSTLLEVNYALTHSMNICGISVITNVWNNEAQPTHTEVLDSSEGAKERISQLIANLLEV
jgi:purine-nucleoside phosphorylase